MKTHFHKLKNGLDVILVDTEAFPSLSSLLLVNAGSRFEDKKNNGIAHFFEHMAFKGSKKYPSSFVLSSMIEGLGGEFNAFTSKDYTGYFVKAPAKHAEPVIDVLADMIQTPMLSKDEIKREKGVIAQEIAMYEDTPQRWVFRLYENLLYKGTKLGMNVLGTHETTGSFNRKTFTDYLSELYYPNNSLLILSGGLTYNGGKQADYIDIIEEKYGGWKKGKASTYTSIEDTQEQPQTLLQYKKSEQAHLCLGYRTFGYGHKDEYALSILNSVLGRGMSSRLFIEVRERRGLCYSIHTYSQHYQEVGNMLTYAGVSTDEKKVQETIKVILDQYNLIADKGITDEELVRAKELVKGRLILSLEDSFNVAFLYGKEFLHEGIHTPVKEILEKIDAVSKKEVQTLAQKLFIPSSLNLALIGPFKKEESFAKLLI